MEIPLYAVVGVGVGITALSGGAISYIVLEGISEALRAKYSLTMISAGDEIKPSYHWAVQDAKIDPIASMIMKFTGGRKAIFRAVREGRQKRSLLETQAE